MSALLDAHVKGSLPSGLPPSTLLNPASSALPPHPTPRTPAPPTNPLDTAPSSPQQIYLNLLILEASLRSQYLSLTLRRRKYTFFFLLLFLWNSYFTHIVFIRGPSPYYYVCLLQKLALGAGLTTLAIFWLSGLHKKTLVFPRKFVGNTNKGLRQFNIKLVSVPLSLWERTVGWLVIFPVVKYVWPWCPGLPYIPLGELEVEKGRSVGEVLRSFLKHGHHGPPNPAHLPPQQSPTPGRKRRLSQARMPTPPCDPAAPHSTPLPDEEPLQPSGSHVKLVILPKGFSPDFREGWEIYRTDYWEKENERRANLRKQIRSRQSFFARLFTPAPPTTAVLNTPRLTPHDRILHTPLHPQHLRDSLSTTSSRRGTPEPIPLSRSATPDLILEPGAAGEDGSPRRPRRGSSASLTRPHRRSTSTSLAAGGVQTQPSPPPVMGPLTPLRAELFDESAEVSDAGSVRSLGGSSVGEGGGAGGKGRRGGRKIRGGKRGKGKGVLPGAGEAVGGSKPEGSSPGATPS